MGNIFLFYFNWFYIFKENLVYNLLIRLNISFSFTDNLNSNCFLKKNVERFIKSKMKRKKHDLDRDCCLIIIIEYVDNNKCWWRRRLLLRLWSTILENITLNNVECHSPYWKRTSKSYASKYSDNHSGVLGYAKENDDYDKIKWIRRLRSWFHQIFHPHFIWHNHFKHHQFS